MNKDLKATSETKALMSSASGSKDVEVKFEHKNIPLCNELRMALCKESKKMETAVKEFKALKAKLQHQIAGADDGSSTALAEKVQTVTAGVELWDKLEQEILKLCNQLGDAFKMDEKQGEVLLSEGKIAQAKLDSMIKGAKGKKTAINAILAAVSPKD